MTADEIERRKAEIVSQYGPWTVEDIDLGEGVLTFGRADAGGRNRLRAVVQTIADAYNMTDLRGIRVLDLGCLEGLFSIELARHGADVVGVDVRAANLAKARFAAEMCGLKIAFHHDDAINVTADKYGTFDVVLFAGLLYHLNVRSIIAVFENISGLIKRLALIDTCFALDFDEQFDHNGETYFGQSYIEFHDHEFFAEQVEAAAWSSNRDKIVFFLTVPSLVRLLSNYGFSSVQTVMVPESRMSANRGLFVAHRNQRLKVKTGSDAFKAMQGAPILEGPSLTLTTPGKGRPPVNPESRKI
jgi:SAM-dependent methyltransferase